MLPRVADELGLTDEQLEEIQAILDAARPEIEDAREQLHALRETRRENHDPAVFNEGEVRAFAADLAEVQADLMVLGERTRAAIRRYQKDFDLDSSILSLTAARSLGLVAVPITKS